MADWAGVRAGISQGYLLGKDSGGKLSGLGMILNKVANQLTTQRQTGEAMAQKQQLLGMEEASKINVAREEAKIRPQEWKPQTREEAVSFEQEKEKAKIPSYKEWKPQSQEEALSFEGAKAGLKKGLTLSNAIGMLSDPMKARQLKRTYPKLYEEAENVVRANLGEDVLAKMTPTKTQGKLPTKIAPETENLMDTNW